MTIVLEIGRSPGRKTLQDGQCSRVLTLDLVSGEVATILESDRLIESPNWTPDGGSLVVNSEGLLYRVSLADGTMEHIETGALDTCNNDHVLSPDGQRIYLSASGHLYVVPIDGGEPRKLSNDHATPYSYWLHGVSPDEAWLAYVAVEPKGDTPRGHRYVALLPTAGGRDVAISDRDVGADGPEYSPDGRWIYFNSELAAKRPGHSQIFRMRPDGADVEQLTFDENVNWFPHLSPDGTSIAYLAYAPGTISHPADVTVTIRRMPAEGGEPSDVHRLFGGQGSLNVNTWSPDGRRIAFVDYPARSN